MSINASSLSSRIEDLARLQRLLSGVSHKRTLNSNQLYRMRFEQEVGDDSSSEKKKLILESESLGENFKVLMRTNFLKISQFVKDYDDHAVEQLANELFSNDWQRELYIKRLSALRADISSTPKELFK